MSKLFKPVIYLQGGLGNQLFQYVFYLNLLANDDQVKFDIGRLIHDKQHNNISVVDFLQLNENSYRSSKNKSLPYLIKDSIISKFIRYVLRRLNIRKTSSSFYDYDAMTSYADLGKDKKNYIGYFQFVDSALFAKSFLESKLSELYRKELDSYLLSYSGKVGLHIRRGDFVTSKDIKHDCVSLDYVKSAINSTLQEIVVFSDDINWCKENLYEYPSLKFHNGSNAFYDFLALSQCSNYILSGSTFSWWAAFLFSSKNTEVVFPKGQGAQFLSNNSNKKIGWLYS